MLFGAGATAPDAALIIAGSSNAATLGKTVSHALRHANNVVVEAISVMDHADSANICNAARRLVCVPVELAAIRPQSENIVAGVTVSANAFNHVAGSAVTSSRINNNTASLAAYNSTD